MNIYRFLFSRFKWQLFMAVIASMFSAGVSLGMLWALKQQLNTAVEPVALPWICAGILLLFGTGVFAQQLLTNLGHHVVFQLRKVLVKRILDTDLPTLERIGNAPLYAVLTKDITAIGSAFNQLPFVAYNCVLVVIGCIYMGYLSPALLGFVVIGLLLGGGIAYGLVSSMRQLMKKVRECDDDIFEGYAGVLDGRYELTLNSQRQQVFYEKSVLPACENARDTEIKADQRGILARNISLVLVLSLLFGIFGLGSALQLSNDIIIGFMLILLFLRTPLNDLTSHLPTLMQGKVSVQKLLTLQLANYEETFEHSTIVKPFVTNKFTLELNDISYKYSDIGQGNNFHLGPINFHMRSGEIIFIIGGNGSGKSTFAKILTGLYTPDAGSIRFNNIAITEENRAWYRHHFSAIFSDFHLFKDLIGPAKNTGESYDKSLAEELINLLKIKNKITISNAKISSTKLSQGQRKRLAMLLAYIEQRPIWLLDEWAADQDPEYRAFFYLKLLPILRDKGITIVAITHDDQYFSTADRVLKCEEGRLYLLNNESTIAN